ncbi:hypothetical protein D3C86_2018890 [compost metagenome]
MGFETGAGAHVSIRVDIDFCSCGTAVFCRNGSAEFGYGVVVQLIQPAEVVHRKRQDTRVVGLFPQCVNMLVPCMATDFHP